MGYGIDIRIDNLIIGLLVLCQVNLLRELKKTIYRLIWMPDGVKNDCMKLRGNATIPCRFPL